MFLFPGSRSSVGCEKRWKSGKLKRAAGQKEASDILCTAAGLAGLAGLERNDYDKKEEARLGAALPWLGLAWHGGATLRAMRTA